MLSGYAILKNNKNKLESSLKIKNKLNCLILRILNRKSQKKLSIGLNLPTSKKKYQKKL
jgi:hypothetical protein